jgi:porphobilinogen synthase
VAFKRFRRLRKTENIRKMVQEVEFRIHHFIYPLFFREGTNIIEEIPSMPGQLRYSPDKIDQKIEELTELGINNVLLFGVPAKKDPQGSEAYNESGIVQQAVRAIKAKNQNMTVITDICMCEYTSHGHCGILKERTVDNDPTIDYLAKIAISHVEAGADIVAPSDMMDGRIWRIRKELDVNGYTDIAILAYSTKYASNYYSPFRDAAESAPEFGNRKGYQMDFCRRKEAVAKVLQDIEEGADIVMVKPALAYLDVVKEVSQIVNVPVAVYNVSGEYAMVKAAALNGWIDERKIVMENMTSYRRAGADIIISYHAPDIAKWLKEEEL